MLHWSQIYRFCSSPGLRSVRALFQLLYCKSHPLQFHYTVFDHAIPMASATQEIPQQYYQAPCGQDSYVCILRFVSIVLMHFPPVRHSLLWSLPVSMFSS